MALELNPGPIHFVLPGSLEDSSVHSWYMFLVPMGAEYCSQRITGVCWDLSTGSLKDWLKGLAFILPNSELFRAVGQLLKSLKANVLATPLGANNETIKSLGAKARE